MNMQMLSLSESPAAAGELHAFFNSAATAANLAGKHCFRRTFIKSSALADDLIAKLLEKTGDENDE